VLGTLEPQTLFEWLADFGRPFTALFRRWLHPTAEQLAGAFSQRWLLEYYMLTQLQPSAQHGNYIRPDMVQWLRDQDGLEILDLLRVIRAIPVE
jgi:hypothetical protein